MNKQTKVMEYKLEMISLIQISTLKQLITTNKHLSSTLILKQVQGVTLSLRWGPQD